MGCGASRADPNNNRVPPRLRPILRQRLDEMRVRRGHAQTTPVATDNNSGSPSDQSHDHHFQDCSEKFTNNPSPKINKDDGDGDDDDDEVTFRPMIMHVEEKEGNGGKIGEKKTEEVIKGSSSKVEEDPRIMLTRYSSPSFRIYCSTSCSSIDNNPMVSDSEEFEGFSDSEYTAYHSISTNEESIGSNHEVSVKNQNKKSKKGRRFKQIIMAKGGKNRFHIHSLHLHHNIKHKLSDNPHILQTTVA